MAKRVCWLLIEVARQDTEWLQPLEHPAVGLATIFCPSQLTKAAALLTLFLKGGLTPLDLCIAQAENSAS